MHITLLQTTVIQNALWPALLLIAAGTFVMRAVPFIWTHKHLAKHNGTRALPTWLGILGSCTTAALLGVSMVPGQPNLTAWLATGIGILTTLLVWHKTRSMGLPILAGVMAFGMALMIPA
ncbi:AzlD domain-containing protein [Bacterioplanoides sp. SCSIO 12839]|uniref:AzlD domain-containing protein n=1 Tax=Bacterioplanoides sp. SCSIO 12839 TaxID=2829569 RepID=UPI0021041526|nr:AzlD domain-containing protein [Bacterioplanoides sp. SCSIO 12839]